MGAELTTITQGEFAGWQQAEPGDTFNGLIGAYYYDTSQPGKIRVGFRAQQQHLNGGGTVHGGCLLTLADTSLFIFAQPHLDGGAAVTLQLDAQFQLPGHAGDIIVCSGEITRVGRTVIFGRGEIHAGDRLLMNFTGILARKKTPPQGDG